MRAKAIVLLAFCTVLLPALAAAQQTGTLVGKVSDSGGLTLPGVTVEAKSNSLPTPRTTVTGNGGEFQMPALPPGDYTVTFTLSGMTTVTREARVQLNLETTVNATLSVGGVTETVEVLGQFTPAIEKDSTAIKSGVSSDTIQALPVGQEYRDLLKLIPGVSVTQDSTRGQSAGGSGQDNVYKFDGVNVTLPLFGTLSAEPASYDIAEVTTIKGGAKAVDFVRAAGFTVDTISRSGTNRFSGQVSYQFQGAEMAAKVQSGSASKYNQTLSWFNASLGGPVVPSKLLFYASYYRPERDRDNRSNLYGELPDYNSTRNEGYGKLTFTPTSQILINGSYRYSHRLDRSDLFGQASAPTTGTGYESTQKIFTADGSWVINARSFASFKYTYFENPNVGRPDYVADTNVNTAIGTPLDLANLDKIGLLTVPSPLTGEDAANAFFGPYIQKYGYISPTTGQKTGGGLVGYGTLFDNDDFYRNSWQIAYNLNLGSKVLHDLHFGYQRYSDWEELLRSSNGWGSISIPGGRSGAGFRPPQGGPQAYFIAAFQQQTTGAIPPIESTYKSQSFEANDTIRYNNWSFNLGLLISNDTLYGQGLEDGQSTASGYVASPGTVYKMYEIPWSKMIQPRVGATWAYNGNDTVYASWATYNPAASSLPRAASWARNLAVTINAFFDQNGILYAVAPNAASTGKLFQPDMTPRTTQEFILGTSRQFTPRLTARLYGRYRYSDHFWEDTNNNARQIYGMPADWAPAELYIPNRAEQCVGLGCSASSYVIADLDRAYTKYYEATAEAEYRGGKVYARGSYTWSKYYGNFDQDNSTAGTANDGNIFIGSSNIGDGAGRQLWNFKEGRLHGDRPHALKMYGYYSLGWNATVGGFFTAQSGQIWEATSVQPYVQYTSSTSATNRYAEPAGSRRTDAWYLLDLNYIQNIPLGGRYRMQAIVDLYNVFNSQTGYNYVSNLQSTLFNTPQSFLSPRRVQISAKFQF
jgi:hypothetical protein